MAKKLIPLTDSKSRNRLAARPEPGNKIDTLFGVVTVLQYKNGKITVLLSDNIKATFNEIEFFLDFAL